MLRPAFRQVCLAVLGLVLAGPAGSTLAAADREPEPRGISFQEFYHSFRGQQELRPPFELWGQDAAHFVLPEQEGLRISLPADYPVERPVTGVALPMVVKGDFQITVSFEILQAPDPADLRKRFGPGRQTRFTLDIVLNKPGLNAASMSRMVDGNGFFLVSCSGLQPELERRPRIQMDYFPTKLKTERLRLARRGGQLFYYASPGPETDFKLMQKYPFAADDLQEVRCVGTTGSPKTALDVRVKDLQIRGESLPGLPAAAAPAEEPAGGTEVWLLVALAACLVATLSLGLWWRLRRRAGGKPSSGNATGTLGQRATISFHCIHCGKKLQAKSQTAGKKVKCPGCGKAALVPAADTG